MSSNEQEGDPFFEQVRDTKWNCCIGSQGDEENYADGYIEAALELVDAVISQESLSKRDTLVLPILYNARHAIELRLKLVIQSLLNMGLIAQAHPKNHNIRSHWLLLRETNIGDEFLTGCIAQLKPFILSLSRVDESGQELRYAKTRGGKKSLEQQSLVNLLVVKEGLDRLYSILDELKYRSYSLTRERQTGTFTNACSRRDLFEITKLLPPRANWNSDAFTVAKNAAIERYKIGSRQFSLALNKIQESRELKSVLGVETQLLHISDEEAALVISEWRRLHPAREDKEDIGTDYFSPVRLKRSKGYVKDNGQIITGLAERLGSDAVADLEAIFYIARDKVFSEHYEESARRFQREAHDGNVQRLSHLLSKTNFGQAFIAGVRMLGRPSLADVLERS